MKKKKGKEQGFCLAPPLGRPILSDIEPKAVSMPCAQPFHSTGELHHYIPCVVSLMKVTRVILVTLAVVLTSDSVC